MTVVVRMTVAVVDVVDMVAVRYGYVSAPHIVAVTVVLVHGVRGRLALVGVAVVVAMEVAVVHVVDMVGMGHGHMAAAGAVLMGVLGVLGVGGSRHDVAILFALILAVPPREGESAPGGARMHV